MHIKRKSKCQFCLVSTLGKKPDSVLLKIIMCSINHECMNHRSTCLHICAGIDNLRAMTLAQTWSHSRHQTFILCKKSQMRKKVTLVHTSLRSKAKKNKGGWVEEIQLNNVPCNNTLHLLICVHVTTYSCRWKKSGCDIFDTPKMALTQHSCLIISMWRINKFIRIHKFHANL